jgi:hypothetical protein
MSVSFYIYLLIYYAMSYTRDCTGCSAKITWNDTKKQYEDELFPGEKHDHKKFEAALAQKGEASQESKVTGNVHTQSVDNLEGTECNTCKANGFPNHIIFFNREALSKNKKQIPLEFAEKKFGNFVYHEHQTKENPDPLKLGLTNITMGEYTEDEQHTAPGPEVPVSEGSLAEVLKAWTYEMRTNNAWFAEWKPKLETIIDWMLANGIKPADQLKTDAKTQSN